MDKDRILDAIENVMAGSLCIICDKELDDVQHVKGAFIFQEDDGFIRTGDAVFYSICEKCFIPTDQFLLRRVEIKLKQHINTKLDRL